jgi:hypothetical protein
VDTPAGYGNGFAPIAGTGTPILFRWAFTPSSRVSEALYAQRFPCNTIHSALVLNGKSH